MSTLRCIGLGLLLVPMLARAMSVLSMLPGWDLDPLIMPMPFSGVGPAESISLDCIALVGAAMLAAFAPVTGRNSVRMERIAIILLILGAAGALVHMRPGGWPWLPMSGSLGDRRVGIAWLAAILGAGGIWLCRRDEALRRVAAAVLLGFVVMLAAKAAQQIFIEHPATVAEYRANPERFLAGQGILPDTPMARAFERRLVQPEATGWFGLANVFATVMAGMVIALIGLLTLVKVQGAQLRRGITAAVILAAIAAGFGLVFAGAKGGGLAVAVGMCGLGLSLVLARMRLGTQAKMRLGAAFGLGAVLGPIALIIARGLIGERMGELSLLFRWFYMQGAARIFMAHPMGVGPDGFQQAYLLAKPPISPEEVTSPHSIMFDWLADLGFAGLGWIVLLLLAAAAVGRVLACGAARATTQPNDAAAALVPSAAFSTRGESRLILLIPGLATLLAAWLERGAVTPDGALVRLVGLVFWCIASWGVLSITRAIPGWSVALAAAAASMLAHTQIDVAASWPQSVGLIAIWIGLSCGAGPADAVMTTGGPYGRMRWAIVVVSAIAIALSGCLGVWRWQRGLLNAKDQLADVAELNMRFAALSPSTQRQEIDALSDAISAALSHRLQRAVKLPPNADPRPVMASLEHVALGEAAVALSSASVIEPGEWRVRREASRLYLRAAAAAKAAADEAGAGEALARAPDVMGLSPPTQPNAVLSATASEWRWLAIVEIERAKAGTDPSGVTQHLATAASSLELAAALDPYNLEIALRLMRVYTQLGDVPDAHSKARAWADKALQLDPLMRLDREARGLTDSERAEAEQTARRP